LRQHFRDCLNASLVVLVGLERIANVKPCDGSFDDKSADAVTSDLQMLLERNVT